MFTQKCFIRKVNQSILSSLQDLGYDIVSDIKDYKSKNGISLSNGQAEPLLNDDINDLGIDCKTNTDLFLALAALNDTTDYKQWFTTDDKKITGWTVLCMKPKFSTYIKSEWRKMTPDELIKMFEKN